MNSSRIALIAAVAAVAGWTLKAVAIGTAGGLDGSPFEGPLFFAGLLSYVVATVAFGVACTRGRPRWVRVVTGAVVAPALAIGVTSVVGALVASLQPADPDRHWVWAEVGLWAVALMALTMTLALAVHRRESVPSTEGFGKARLAG
ncbi:MAG: hypothetical protein ACRDUA_23375 [Micromonosporaceae bacterium]